MAHENASGLHPVGCGQATQSWTSRLSLGPLKCAAGDARSRSWPALQWQFDRKLGLGFDGLVEFQGLGSLGAAGV